MKKKLQKWLLLFFLISFCATSALTYVVQTKLAERTAVLTIRARINYLRYQIDEHEKSVESLSKKIKQILKEKATNLIVNLKSDPALAQDAAFLNTWRKNNELRICKLSLRILQNLFFFLKRLQICRGRIILICFHRGLYS